MNPQFSHQTTVVFCTTFIVKSSGLKSIDADKPYIYAKYEGTPSTACIDLASYFISGCLLKSRKSKIVACVYVWLKYMPAIDFAFWGRVIDGRVRRYIFAGHVWSVGCKL
jgi:hypothetical protein